MLGTPQSQDKRVYAVPEEPEWMFGVEITDDGRYLIISVQPSCENVNRFYYVDLQDVHYDDNGLLKPVKLIDNFEASYNYIANDAMIFYLQTNKNSPKYKIIKLDIANPQQVSNQKQSINFNCNRLIFSIEDLCENQQTYGMNEMIQFYTKILV